MRSWIIRGAVPAAMLAVAFGLVSLAQAANPKRNTTVRQVTANGYKLTVSVAKSGKSGRLKVACPDGKSLGQSARFDIKNGKFKAKKRKRRKRVFSFRGRFDLTTHVIGSGSVRANTCGGSAPNSFTLSTQGQARMTSCPQTTADAPFPANTPYTFKGVMPNAAEGTKLRIEYTIPNSSTGLPAVAHVTTDAAGNFSDVHAFPSAGFIFGAAATPRFPDDALGAGQPCTFDVL